LGSQTLPCKIIKDLPGPWLDVARSLIGALDCSFPLVTPSTDQATPDAPLQII
jgi:hypothetical protein